MIDANGQTTNYQYDGVGNIISKTDIIIKQTTQYQYNACNKSMKDIIKF